MLIPCFNEFKSVYSLFKVLHIFPSQYLYAIGISMVFSFRRRYLPFQTAFPNSLTLKVFQNFSFTSKYRTFTFSGFPFPENYEMKPYSYNFIAYNSKTFPVSDLNFELLPLHSLLLRQSLLIFFPLLSNMFKFSRQPCLLQIQI